jgi:hypothetical protein
MSADPYGSRSSVYRASKTILNLSLINNRIIRKVAGLTRHAPISLHASSACRHAYMDTETVPSYTNADISCQYKSGKVQRAARSLFRPSAVL